jgi:transcriptional regulator of nitric oxide reductase
MAMLRAQKFLALCGRPWLAAMLVWLAVLVAVVPQAWAERLPEFLAKTPVAEIFPGADAYGAPEVSLWWRVRSKAASRWAMCISPPMW